MPVCVFVCVCRGGHMCTVSLGQNPTTGRDMNIVVQLPKNKRTLPDKDDLIYCIFLT